MLLKAIALAVIPVLEFLALRNWTHATCLRPGFPGFTDYDLVFPGLCAFIFYVGCLQLKKVLNLGFFWPGAVANLVLVGFFLLLTQLGRNTPMAAGDVRWTLWFLIGSSSIVSGIFWWVRPAYFTQNPSRLLVVPASLIVLSKILSRYVFDALWLPVAGMTGRSAYAVLALFTADIKLLPNQVSGGQTWQVLAHPLHLVSIGTGCSGLEGMFLFLFVALLVLMARWSDFGINRAFLFVGLGLVGMYWMNVFRIVAVDLIGIGLVVLLGAERASQWIEILFHVGVGWMSYLFFLSGYFVGWKWLIEYSRRSIAPSLVPPLNTQVRPRVVVVEAQ